MIRPSEKLRKLLADLEITPSVLAERTGLDPAQISRWLSGNRKRVPPLAALYFAGLTESEDDRQYWLDHSLVSESQRELLAKSLRQKPVSLTGVPHLWARAMAGILSSGNKEARIAIQQQLVLWFRQATGEELSLSAREKKRA
jgi:transcriptional regulator with XRE-family HTH domain